MQVIAADAGLVPWWFAVGFWLALAGLTVVVVRDIRRLGGARAVIRAVRQRLDDAERPDPWAGPPVDPDADPTPDPDERGDHDRSGQ
ncbi:MAG TPA: hypothetical protein VK866_03145 [Acidimicrobiales bacterium]|nr:hypothetical protein [Acidimicrobiales bacterium]